MRSGSLIGILSLFSISTPHSGQAFAEKQGMRRLVALYERTCRASSFG
jgi:hypothetical protein